MLFHSAMRDRSRWGGQRFGHADGRGRAQRAEFGAFLELFGSVTAIDDLVAETAEECFRGLG